MSWWRCAASAMGEHMKLYEFTLHQPNENTLEWLANEAEKRRDSSPAFFDAVINACREELRLREHDEDKHATLRVPWILEDQGPYIEACAFVSNAQLVANKNAHIILRNLLGVMLEVLYDMMDQGISHEQGEDVWDEPRTH